MRINNVIDYLENIVNQHPDKSAFVGECSKLTFKELKDSADTIAGFIIDKEIYKEPVLVFMEKSPEEAAAFLGVIESGNCHVAMDLEMADGRLSYIMKMADAKIMICDSFTKEKAVNLGFRGEIISFDEIKGRPNQEKLAEIRRMAIDTDPIYIVFTSGSTGVPKGVIANHRSVIDYIEELGKVLECDETTVFGNQAPLYLDACLKDVYTTMKYGATTYLIPKKLFMSPVKLIEYLNENKINTICFVVSALTILTKLGAFEFAKPEYLRTIAFGGEVFPLNHFKEWKNACPKARFINLYGTTECTGMSSFYVVDKIEEIENVIPIGKPFPNTGIFLLNEKDEAVVKGEKGEICIRGTALTMGYYKDPERTKESFVQNPLNKAFLETIYRTGDIGYFNENNDLIFVGRKDNQIKHMGYRIELEEIEALGNSFENVVRGVCIYDKERGKICFAYQGNPEVSEVKVLFKEKLPAYMVPEKVVKLDNLPVMTGGKIDKINILKIMR